jgi:hypothetical protein
MHPRKPFYFPIFVLGVMEGGVEFQILFFGLFSIGTCKTSWATCDRLWLT